MPPPKLHRADYHVAWISPLSDLELLPARLMLDDEHDTPEYDRTYDDNIYICGTLAGHNVVIATCPPGMTGNVNAGHVTNTLFRTFSRIRMAVLVGIGGGIPRALPPDDPTEDVHLGDVVVGWPGDGGPACIYYDSGRWHSDRQFEVLGTINRPDRVLLNALGKLTSDHEMDRSTFKAHRERLLRSKHRKKFEFPGLKKHWLFQASYRHVGVHGDGCAQCDASKFVSRPERTQDSTASLIFHRGRIATGNAVIQDGKRRDDIRDLCNGALCVEMEAAGVDASRPCLVIRGISDYADSHKCDDWRSFAAGNAAVFARELLSKIPPSNTLNVAAQVQSGSHFLVPFGRNRGFVGREGILMRLLNTISPVSQEENCQRTVIQGLGGIGKTQVAIEAAYRVHEAYPDCSIFWVPAVDMAMFDNACREIGRALGVKGIEEDKADVKALVKAALSRADAGNWLLIVDNIDDVRLLSDERLMQSLPFSRAGSILFTTRSHQVAVRFDTLEIVRLGELDEEEARQLLHQRLLKSQIGQPENTRKLLEYLAYLPLAIRQSSAYLASNSNVTVLGYLEYCQSSDESMIKMLSKAFDDQGRYQAIQDQNPIATTWLVSFQQLSRDAPLAARYLRSIAYFAEKDIPMSLLPAGGDEMEKNEAIGTLRAYAFILDRGRPDRFDVHRLVRLAMRNWLQSQDEQINQVTEVVRHLLQEFPLPSHKNRNIWAQYLPHTRSVLEMREECTEEKRLGLLETKVAACYDFLGQFAEGEEILRKTLALRRRVLGDTHRSTLKTMSNLANALRYQGKFSEAESIHRKTLALRVRVLGHEHHSTLSSMDNVACLLTCQGRYVEAEDLHRETLAMRERVLGYDHRDTFESKSNLAVALDRQGRDREVEELHRETLALRKRVLGHDHPDTLDSMSYLEDTLYKQGKYAEAEEVVRRTLVLQERVLGHDHPNTIRCMHNLATVLERQRQDSEAKEIDDRIRALRLG